MKKEKIIFLSLFLILGMGLAFYIINKLNSMQDIIDKQSQYMNKIQLNMNEERQLIQYIQDFIKKTNKNLEYDTSFLYAEEIVKTSNRYNKVDPLLLTSIIHQESRFNAHAESPAGALGLGQIMQETSHWILEKWNVPYSDSTVYDYKMNIRMMCWYIEWLFTVPKTTQGKLEYVLAWYNGGAKNAYRYYLLNKKQTKEELIEIKKIPKETLNYVSEVIKKYETLKKEFEG